MLQIVDFRSLLSLISGRRLGLPVLHLLLLLRDLLLKHPILLLKLVQLVQILQIAQVDWKVEGLTDWLNQLIRGQTENGLHWSQRRSAIGLGFAIDLDRTERRIELLLLPLNALQILNLR